MNKFEYDVIVIGGGTSGVAAAISASRGGAKVLLIEKNSYLGGAMTAQLVTPMMNNISFKDESFKKSILFEILSKLYSSNDGLEYKDGNPGWFNPEKMKCVLENIATESDVEILFDSTVIEVIKDSNYIKGIKVFYRGTVYTFYSKYFIDATGDANVAYMSGVEFDCGIDGKNQFMSLRFELGGVNIFELSQWMISNNIDDDVSNVYKKNEKEIYLSLGFSYGINKTNYKAVNQMIEKAIKNKDIEESDISYLQFFSVPNKIGVLSFNCPRIDINLNPLSPFDSSHALIEGRKRIEKLTYFMKKYFPGFENSYISCIASELGVRDSRRIKSEYILSKKDIEEGKNFDNPIFESDYPIDIHQKGESICHKRHRFSAPIDCCISKKVRNLFVTGRCIGADFYAQAALRIQPNCFSMGEKIGIYISYILRNDTF